MKKVTLLFAVLLSCFFWQANAQCTTPVGAFTENFGSTPLGQLPACWNKLFDGNVNGLEKVEVTNTASNSAPNSIVFTGGQGSFGVANGYAVTPQLADLQSGIYSVNFYAWSPTLANFFHLKVGTMSNPNDASTFQAVQDILLPATKTNYIVNFTSPPAGHNYVAFKVEELFNNYFSYIDDVIWTPPITCPAPSGLAVSGITSTGANLDWAPGATETKWDIEYGTDGFALGSGTLVNDDDAVSDETLSGLSPSTAYDFYVRAECAPTDLSFWTGPFSFVTSCVPYNAFTEDFDATAVGSLPVCWGVIDNSINNSETWSIGIPGSGSAHSGSQVAEIPHRNLGFGGSSNDYLITPQISVVAGSSDWFEFYARSEDAAHPEKVNVLLSTTGKVAADFTVTLEGPISLPGTWTKYKYNLTAYVGQNIYIAIQAITPTVGFNYNAYGLYVDDAVLKVVPTCLQPINLTATAITSSTADLGWTDANTTAPGSWDVDIELAGNPQAAPITATGVTANSYPATGLASNTDYVFYVRANCGGGDFSVWSGPFAFTTLCAPYGSFTENFDALPQDVLPDCWDSLIISTDAPYVKTDATNSYSMPHNLKMYNVSDENADVFAITPELTDLANGTHQLRFFARGDGDTSEPADGIEVGTMTDPTNIATYTMVQSFVLTPNYQEFIVRFDTPVTPDTYIAIKGVFGDNGHIIRIDDVFWEPIPACLKPDNLGVISLEDTSANLDWDEIGTATAWSIEYGAPGFVQATAGTIVSDTDGASDEIITGLVASTNYEFYVRADCGGTAGSSIWKGPFPFTTLCAPSALPFTETFDDPNTPTPACWVESGDTSWDFSTFASGAAQNVQDHTAGGGTDYAWMDGSDNKDGETGTLASPLVDVSTLTTPALEFYVFSNNTNDAAINILDVDFYDGAAWHNLVHQTSLLGTDWVRFLIDLGSYTISDDVRVRFTVSGNSNGGNTTFHDILIDDVSFIEMPPCPIPAALTASNITTTTADLGWTEYGSATTWDIEFGAAGFAPTGTPTHPNVTSNPYTISGLNSCNIYEFYVRADCGGNGTSNWAGPFQFYSQTAPQGSFSQNFDALALGAVPTCWSTLGNGSKVVTDSESNSAPHSFGLVYPLSFGPGQMYLITPELSDLQNGSHQIRFFAKKGSVVLEVGTMSDPGNPGTFHLVASIPATAAFTEFTVPFPSPTAGDKYVAFKVSAQASGGSAYIDDIFWEDPVVGYTYNNNAWTPAPPSGNSTANDDIVVMNGTASFTLDTRVANLTVDAGAVLRIEQVLSVSGNITNNGGMIFVNDGTVLGQLDDMTGSTITGNGELTVQRHIPAQRAYRFLSPAVTTTTNINANWQEGVHNTGTNYPADNLDPNPGFGTHITGSTTGANGFDATQSGYPSLYEFDVLNQAWVAVANTDVNTLSAGDAMLIFVRGDRGINLSSTASPLPTSSTILRATGSLKIGNYTDTSLSTVAGGYSLVGNPYQAIVNMNDVLANSTNLNTGFYYVWNPNLSTNGAYALVNLPGGASVPASGANEFLQPGQGAFVSTLAAGPATFLVEEPDKDVEQTPTNVFKPGPAASIALELYEAGNFANAGTPTDGFLVNFNPGGNNAVNSKDAPKPMNFNENVGLVNGTSLLIMENRDMPTHSDVLPLYNDNYGHTDYVYQIQVEGMAQMTPVLTDAYLGVQSPLQDGLNSIAFSVDASIAASVAPDRFSIVFVSKGLGTQENAISSFELFPNPVKGNSFFILALNKAGQHIQVSLYDLLGRKIYGTVKEVGPNNRIEVNASGLQTGVYMVELYHNGKTLTRKLIVE